MVQPLKAALFQNVVTLTCTFTCCQMHLQSTSNYHWRSVAQFSATWRALIQLLSNISRDMLCHQRHAQGMSDQSPVPIICSPVFCLCQKRPRQTCKTQQERAWLISMDALPIIAGVCLTM